MKTMLSILAVLIFNNEIIAQYSKNTTVATLTNKGSRTWHMDPVVKTLGGCLEEELEITFKADYTVEFQYCQNGKMISKFTTWKIDSTGITNEWDITFSEPCKYQSNEKLVQLNKNRLKLLSKAVDAKGVKMDLSIFIPQDNLSTRIITYNFISLN